MKTVIIFQVIRESKRGNDIYLKPRAFTSFDKLIAYLEKQYDENLVKEINKEIHKIQTTDWVWGWVDDGEGTQYKIEEIVLDL